MVAHLTIFLPDVLLRQLDALVPALHTTRSEAVTRAVELYLYRLACERDANIYERFPLTDDEMAFAADPEVWSTAPPW
jgi:hypothetical protein